MNEQRRLTFYHPRDSRTFAAEVDPQTTAERCIAGLIDARFLEPGNRDSYALMLQRTNQQIPPSSNMDEAGVRDRDDIVVLQEEKGARV